MSIYDTLNKEQKEAVLRTDGPVLLLAGAGSGKTRVLTHRIAYLIDEMGVKPWNILAITFTNKAAGEMRDRVDRLVGFGADQVWVSTFHSSCVRILRRYIDRIGYDNGFTIYDADDQKTVMKAVIRRLNLDPKIYKERNFLSAVSSAKDELISMSEFERRAAGDYNRSLQARAYREYQETLRANNALDFDDIIVKTVELFRNCPEVLDSYQERFQYIMVDEYQDTNTAQFELVRLLAEKYRNFCVVGDDDQSIYKFRGANIRNILDFEKYFPEAAVIRLEQNYRSTQAILDAANAVIRNNTGRKEKTLWTGRMGGEKVRFRQFDSAYEEAEYIAEEIARKAVKKGMEYRDCAVLFRTNAQARLLEERMIMEGVPYNVVGGTNFYSRLEIKDILAYLKTVDSGRDDVAVRRIINVPRRGIGNATLEKAEEFARLRGIGLYSAFERVDEIEGLGRAAAKIRSFVELIRKFREARSRMTVAELIQLIIEQIGYEAYLQDYDDDGEDRIANVDELITKAVNYAKTHEEATLQEFLEEVALVADIDNVNDNDNRVLLMTLHSAKGLEFPCVYLAGLEDGLFPGYMAVNSDSIEDLEEERRLAYVGITRAKDELILTSARTRMIRGETQYNPVSRFVREIPPELLESGSAFGRKTADSRAASAFTDRRRDVSQGDSGARAARGSDGVADYRPKAIVRPKVTPKADKPFIAKGIGSLNQLAGISRGAVYKAPEALTYSVGDRVSHMKYGEGKVIKIDREERDYKVTVNFDKAGQKIMYASFAKLKRL
ncbi:ATP-dependent helicase [Acetatifactor muris]|uniref:ATP-dependent helicase n=1 Tax=Acetatifactor muris TaxID=879566 RepID=UPI0023F2ED6B|nr:UvrD-helicase domain-containing protein [Acetatifactor muris]